jgi:hypothetical protein
MTSMNCNKRSGAVEFLKTFLTFQIIGASPIIHDRRSNDSGSDLLSTPCTSMVSRAYKNRR